MTDLQSTSGNADPVDHAELRTCALYLTGGLVAEAELAFERHLGSCPRCLDECDRLGPLVTAMSEFDAGQIEAVLAENPFPPAAAPFDVAPAGAGPTGVAPAGPVRPTAPPKGGRPAGRPGRSQLRRRLTLSALAVVAVVSLGVALSLQSSDTTPGGGQTTIAPRPVAVTAEGVGGSVRLSVTVVARTDRSTPTSTITATIVGLPPGEQYRLYAVTSDAETHQVAEGTASAGTVRATGEFALPIDQLAFFAVTRLDGGTLVSARIIRSTPTR
jgi:hypothetical protein